MKTKRVTMVIAVTMEIPDDFQLGEPPRFRNVLKAPPTWNALPEVEILNYSTLEVEIEKEDPPWAFRK